MKGEPKIVITLACAYCHAKLIFSQTAITLTNRHGAVVREGKVAELKCPHCDSVFSVEMTTKRKRQGAGYKRAEARKREIHADNVARAVERNREIAAKLLAQPGCTCADAQREDSPRWRRHGFGDAIDSTKRAERLAEHGHLFATCGSSYGIPTTPHHDQGCPCRGTDGEAAIRGEKGAA